MQHDQARAAFTLTPVHQRRDNNRITAVGTDQGGKRLFLGLSNGFIEEHNINRSASGTYTRVAAEKRISRHPIKLIRPITPAQRLAILTEDSNVWLCAYETYELTSVPHSKSATALAVECSSQYPARLAVAVPVNKKKSKILLFAVMAGSRASSSSGSPIKLFGQLPIEHPVHDLIWMDKHIVAAIPGGYLLITSTSTTLVAENLACPTMLSPIPSTQQVILLFQETLALITDSQGHAQRPPLLLPSTPLALGQAGLYVVAICEDGIHVYDRNSSQQVQHIDFLHDDPHITISRRMPCSDDASGSLVMLATSQVLYCLEAIALEQQVRDLLKRKRFQQALELVQLCREELAASEGAAATAAAGSWVDEALAQAGLLLLLDLQFSKATQVLLRCSPAVFQPCELLPLFPACCQPWLQELRSKPLWGLHGPLPELPKLIADALELKQATSSHGRHGPAAAAAAALSQEELQREAKQQLARYLLTARQQPSVELPDAVDTLLACLLCDVGDAAALEQLMQQQQGGRALGPAAISSMQRCCRWHALALYRAGQGQCLEALQLWQQLGEQQLQEGAASSGAVHAAGGDQCAVALAHVAALLRGGDAVPAAAALQQLPWLLQRSPEAALGVLTERDLPVQQVLEVLAGRSDDLRWRYMQHVVHVKGEQSAALHSELALLLIGSIQAAVAAAGLTGEQLAATAAGGAAAQQQQTPMMSPAGSMRSPSIAQAARLRSVGSYEQLSKAGSSSLQQALHKRSSSSTPAAAGRLAAEQELSAPVHKRSSSAMPQSPRAQQQQWPPEVQRIAAMRLVLLAHLQRSVLYDASAVLQELQGTELWLEQVELHTRLCDFSAALRLLALVIGDVDGAIAYCRQHCGQEGWLALLDLFLRPGVGRQPNYGAACRVLDAEGAALNPLQVLQSLSDDMPLHLAHETLSRMLAGMEHRRRHCQVVRALHRGQHLSAKVEKVELESGRVVVGGDTPCRGCHRLLGDRVFWRYPSGVVLCSRCMHMAEGEGG